MRFTNVNRFSGQILVKVVTKKRLDYISTYAYQMISVETLVWARKINACTRVHYIHIYSLLERRRLPLLGTTWKVREFDSTAQKAVTAECNVVASEEMDCQMRKINQQKSRTFRELLMNIYFIIRALRSHVLHSFLFFVTFCFFVQRFDDVVLRNLHARYVFTRIAKFDGEQEN